MLNVGNACQNSLKTKWREMQPQQLKMFMYFSWCLYPLTSLFFLNMFESLSYPWTLELFKSIFYPASSFQSLHTTVQFSHFSEWTMGWVIQSLNRMQLDISLLSWFWKQPSLLFSGWRDFSLELTWLGWGPHHSPPSSAKVRSECTYMSMSPANLNSFFKRGNPHEQWNQIHIYPQIFVSQIQNTMWH
jgi:hypothetical protein